MSGSRAYPLDLDSRGYAYVERANNTLVELVDRWVLRGHHAPRILDVGCGAGANARAIRRRSPHAVLVGIEPNDQAALQADIPCDEVFVGAVSDWIPHQAAATQPSVSTQRGAFDGVILSDVIEHTADPVAFLESLTRLEVLQESKWILSVPNYAVWYNRLRTLAGSFEYAWSGLYDRTHLRFFTRQSLRRLLDHCGFDVLAETCSPSLVQSAAPLLRRRFEAEVSSGNFLTLGESRAYRAYGRWLEPLEARLCRNWPELLGFQIIVAARLRNG